MRSRAVLRSFYMSAILLSAIVTVAPAQGKSHKVPPGQAKKHVTPASAVVIAREVLVKQGFDVVRIEHVGVTEVVYYRRGSNGRGRGHGPLQKMVVRPSGTIVVFEAAPAPILAEIRIRLGL